MNKMNFCFLKHVTVVYLWEKVSEIFKNNQNSYLRTKCIKTHCVGCLIEVWVFDCSFILHFRKKIFSAKNLWNLNLEF